MIDLPVTALLAGLLTVWFVFLSVRVSFARGAHQVSLGDGEAGSTFNRIVRVQGNAAEYIPLFVLICALLEYHGLRPEVLYVLGGVFLLGRILHRNALQKSLVTQRMWALQLTLWPLAIGAAILLYTWVAQVVIF